MSDLTSEERGFLLWALKIVENLDDIDPTSQRWARRIAHKLKGQQPPPPSRSPGGPRPSSPGAREASSRASERSGAVKAPGPDPGGLSDSGGGVKRCVVCGAWPMVEVHHGGPL
jgi:hypothetical protein